jgi:hypothetical protein
LKKIIEQALEQHMPHKKKNIKKKYNNENLKKYKKKQQKIVQSEVCI